MTAEVLTGLGSGRALGEVRKVGAFVRRDFLVTWSYRFAFFSDAMNLIGQTLVFAYVSRLINPASMPTFGGTRTSYLAFVTIGIALTAFLQIGLGRMVSAVRSEQLMGTLECLLLTPTSLTTFQLGWIAYDLVYVPIRTVLFLLVAALAFGLHFDAAGTVPAVAILLLFIPSVWGVGVASAAAVLTYRRGAGIFSLGAFALTFASGAYFPLDLLPAPVAALARLNPVAIALDGTRRALLGGAGWSQLLPSMAALTVMSSAALAGGAVAFRAALRRELRCGTLGIY